MELYLHPDGNGWVVEFFMIKKVKYADLSFQSLLNSPESDMGWSSDKMWQIQNLLEVKFTIPTITTIIRAPDKSCTDA